MNAARVAPGDLIGGRYQIESILGEGGMAVVYRARHVGTGRPCALKLVHAHLITRPHLVDMFIREAQVGSKIGPNPHIVDVFDAAADEVRRVPYLVMELLEGQTLEQWSERNGPMHPAMVRDVFEQLGDALGQAHRAGVVHRDLKPSNLFLTTDHKGQPLLKVLDFGIAKVLEDDNQRTATQIGTPSYAAPEQFGAMFRPLAEKQGITISAGVSPATDVWAMGLIAYELLTGAKCGHYWDTSNLAELPIKAALSEHEEPASHRAGGRAALLPPGFDAWFARCLRKNAPERWPSAGHAISELGRLLAGFGAPAGLGTQQTAAMPQVPSGYTQQGGPPAYAATPPPQLSSGPFTPGPYTSGPATPGACPPGGYGQGPYTPGPAQAPYGAYPQGPYTQGPYPPGPPAPGTYPPGGYGPPGHPPGAYPQAGQAAGHPQAPGGPIYLGPQGPQMPFVRPPSPTPKASGGSWWLAPLLVVGLIALSFMGTFAYYGVKRYRVLAFAHDCDKEKVHCTEACDGSDMPSCTRLGAFRETGGGGLTRDAAKAVGFYRKACDKGDQTGCASLGHLLLTGRGVTKDAIEGKQLVKQACDAGSQRGCALLGELVRDGEEGKANDTAAVVLFQAACDAGDAVGCRDLGWMHESGRGGLTKNPGRAAPLYQTACDGGDPGGCNHVAVLLEAGKGVGKDLGRAATIYQQACDTGEVYACSNLGMMAELGSGMTKDEPRAMTLYTQSCDDGGSTGCARLGAMYESGKGGLAKDLARAVALYVQACDGGNAVGCLYLGSNEEVGKGVARDEVKATAHYKRSCDYGSPTGCNAFAVMMENGKGGLTRDETKAAVMYKQSCENGATSACSNYGLMLINGKGVPKDTTKSATYFKQACDSDNSAGCSNLGYQYVNGLGLPRDRARGLDLLRRGCSGGYEWGCDQLKAAGGSR